MKEEVRREEGRKVVNDGKGVSCREMLRVEEVRLL